MAGRHHYAKRFAVSGKTMRQTLRIRSASDTAATATPIISPERAYKRRNRNVASLMSNLSKVFSGGKQNASLSTFKYDGTPFTSLEEREVARGPIKTKEDWYTVHLPAYNAWTEARTKEAEEKGQQPDEEMVYRLYKGSSWHECIPKGYDVICYDGVKDVSEISIGDHVLSHDGEYHKVVETSSRYFEGDLVEIKARGMSHIPIRTTPQHPLLVLPIGMSKVSGTMVLTSRLLQWKNAEQLAIGDVLLIPVPKLTLDRDQIRLSDSLDMAQTYHVFNSFMKEPLKRPAYRLSKDGNLLITRQREIINNIGISEDFLWFLGLFLAEGSYNNGNSIGFYLSLDEEPMVRKVLRIGKECFGFDGTLIKRQDGHNEYRINFFSKSLSKIFKSWFGQNVQTKKVPQWILELPSEKQLYFLVGYIQGDGHLDLLHKWSKTYTRFSMVSASRALLFGIIQILLRAKMEFSTRRAYSGFRRSYYEKGFHIIISGEAAQRLGRLMNMRFELPNYLKSGRPLDRHYSTYVQVEGKQYLAVKIKAVSNIPYSGSVYNFAVQGSESYTCNMVSVHNCQHVAYSPPEFLKGGDPDFRSQTKRSLFNIVDDLRIEETGVNRLPGFIPIRLLRQAYWGSRRPDVSELSKNYTDDARLSENENLKNSAYRFARNKFNTRDPTEAQINEAFEEHKESFRKTKRKEVVMEAFTQLLLMGKEKGELPKEDQEKLDNVTSEIRSEVRKLEEEKQGGHETYNSIKKLAETLLQEMNIDPDDKDAAHADLPDPHGDPGEGGQPGQGFDPHEIEQMLNELKPDKEGPREDGDPGSMLTREDIEEALNGTPGDHKEFQKVKGLVRMGMEKSSEEDPTSPEEFEEPLSTGDPQLYRDKKFINEMNEHLSEWRSGWKRVFGTSGTSFNVQKELSTKGEQSFSGRQRLDASKTKTLFVIDLSGSMNPRQEDYKRVIASTMEVLEGIHSQTAIFGFGDPSAEFFKLKDFRQKWNKTRGEKLAGMAAEGSSTPLTTTLNMIEPYVKRHRPQYTVIVTDGDPTDGDPSAIIKTLSKSTHMVGFGLGDEKIAQSLKGFGIRESFSTNNIYDIPKRLIPKIALVS